MTRAAALLLMILAACRPEDAAFRRLRNFVDDHRSSRQWSAADRAEAYRLARAYLDLPRRDDDDRARMAHITLWLALENDPNADPRELLSAVHWIEQYARWPGPRFIRPARVLAERNIDLPYAERLARRGVVESHRYFQQRPDIRRQVAARVIGDAHESLAIVLQKRGRRGEAEQEFAAAEAMKRFASAR